MRPSPSASSSPPTSPATSTTSHELVPLIDQSMADGKSLDDVNNKRASSDEESPYYAIVHDPEFEGLTLYEKKAALVNRELDSHGMGKYQWYIFGLCGLGYLIDLMYAQAFGLIVPAMQNEFGFGGSYSTDYPLASRND